MFSTQQHTFDKETELFKIAVFYMYLVYFFPKNIFWMETMYSNVPNKHVYTFIPHIRVWPTYVYKSWKVEKVVKVEKNVTVTGSIEQTQVDNWSSRTRLVDNTH